jgi:hypothetical protein
MEMITNFSNSFWILLEGKYDTLFEIRTDYEESEILEKIREYGAKYHEYCYGLLSLLTNIEGREETVIYGFYVYRPIATFVFGEDDETSCLTS